MQRIFIAVILMMTAQAAMALSYTLEIPEQELQSKVSAMMPLEKKKYFITMVLSKPVVDLVEGDNRISVFTQIDVKAPGGIKGSGKTKISGSLSYDQETASFFFKDPQIVDLDIAKVPASLMPKIKKLAQTAASKVLASRPIYKLKDGILKHKLAKSLLESITVKNEVLFVELSLF